MLPDFIALKRELSQIIDMSLASYPNEGPLFSLFPAYHHHEGNSFTIYREDGSHETSNYRHFKSEFTIDLLDVQSRGEKAIKEVLAETHKKMEEEKSKHLFDYMSTVAESVGHSIDAKGRPLTAESIIELWDKIEFGFDDDGNWHQPKILINPIQATRVEAELNRIKTEPDLQRRRDEMIARHRKEWNVREANRKLVD